MYLMGSPIPSPVGRFVSYAIDRHLYEHTDNLCLTNVLYRSPDRFQFLAGLNQLLPQEQDGQYPSHWRVNHCVLQQVRQLVAQLEQQEEWK